MKNVIIAEKPSVAQSIAAIVGIWKATAVP